MDHRPSEPRSLIGQDPAFIRILEYGLAAARTEAPILIRGEAGTGKETLARALHAASGRQGPFLVLDAAALATRTRDADLFAAAVYGMEGMGRATLFIRAIEALEPPVQAELADTLRNEAADRARIVAGSCHDLASLCEDAGFSRDLLRELSLIQLHLPALRQRSGDIAAFALHFATRFTARYGLAGAELDPRAAQLLETHDWPGNLRELEEVIHRAVLLTGEGTIAPEVLVLADGTRLGTGDPQQATDDRAVRALVGRKVIEVERALILQTLRRCRGNRTWASAMLGISVRTMRNKLKAFDDAGITIIPAAR